MPQSSQRGNHTPNDNECWNSVLINKWAVGCRTGLANGRYGGPYATVPAAITVVVAELKRILHVEPHPSVLENLRPAVDSAIMAGDFSRCGTFVLTLRVFCLLSLFSSSLSHRRSLSILCLLRLPFYWDSDAVEGLKHETAPCLNFQSVVVYFGRTRPKISSQITEP